MADTNIHDKFGFIKIDNSLACKENVPNKLADIMNEKRRILFVTPHAALDVFNKSKIRVAVPHIPYLSLATLAGIVLQKGHDAKILDLSISPQPKLDLENTLREYQPHAVAITCTTALFPEAKQICDIALKEVPRAFMMTGGAHPSNEPIRVLHESKFDAAIFGEGEITLSDIVMGKPLNEINGLSYRHKGEVFINQTQEFIQNLDELPLPAWQLYDLSKYVTPRLTSRKNPVGAMETSRGCPYVCTYCNKGVFTIKWRSKSAKRVVDEMEYMLKCGFKEIHIWDDMFSTDKQRAKDICDMIVARGLKFPWNIYNGIRVDSVDQELLHKLKAAGCYRVSFGMESGNQKVLDGIKKGITLQQGREAFAMARKAGLETLGFFMLGLPDDTEETMQETIDFAKSLEPDIPKAGILMPLPGTPLYREWVEKGIVQSFNWEEFVFHAPAKVYKHPNLTYEKVFAFYNKFYKENMLNPRFLFRRLIRDIKTGELPWDIYYFIKTMRYGW
jgi:radical SAM superfamily enzyme YgiQ (UPF0313 family)